MLAVWRAQWRAIEQELSAESSTLPEVDWSAFEAAQRDVLEPYLQRGVRFGVGQGARELGLTLQTKSSPELSVQLDWAIVNRSAVDWAQNYTFDLVRGITETTQRRLQETLSAWLESGEAFPALQVEMEKLFDNPQRAELIAVTEGTRAVSEGNAQTWNAAGVWGSEWRTAEDELVCPICGGLNRQRRPSGENFTVTVQGRVTSIPRPPAHPGCRCTRVPVVRPDVPPVRVAETEAADGG